MAITDPASSYITGSVRNPWKPLCRSSRVHSVCRRNSAHLVIVVVVGGAEEVTGTSLAAECSPLAAGVSPRNSAARALRALIQKCAHALDHNSSPRSWKCVAGGNETQTAISIGERSMGGASKRIYSVVSDSGTASVRIASNKLVFMIAARPLSSDYARVWIPQSLP